MISCNIITVVRNGEKSIAKTLASISNQDYPQIKHIIIDGNSNDSTIKIVKSFPHKKECQIYHQQSIGITAAFNDGLQQVSGDLVLFLNAGDSLVDKQVITRVAESYKNDSWLWAFGETISVSRKGYLKRHIKQYSHWEEQLFFYGNPICHQSTFFSQKILEQLGCYDEKISLAMDYEFNIRASLISEPYLLSIPISYYDTSGISSMKVFESHNIQKNIRKQYFPLTEYQNFMIDTVCYFKAFKRFLMIPIKLYL